MKLKFWKNFKEPTPAELIEEEIIRSILTHTWRRERLDSVNTEYSHNGVVIRVRKDYNVSTVHLKQPGSYLLLSNRVIYVLDHVNSFKIKAQQLQQLQQVKELLNESKEIKETP